MSATIALPIAFLVMFHAFMNCAGLLSCVYMCIHNDILNL
jgi:hypothetical protein